MYDLAGNKLTGNIRGVARSLCRPISILRICDGSTMTQADTTKAAQNGVARAADKWNAEFAPLEHVAVCSKTKGAKKMIDQIDAGEMKKRPQFVRLFIRFIREGDPDRETQIGGRSRKKFAFNSWRPQRSIEMAMIPSGDGRDLGENGNSKEGRRRRRELSSGSASLELDRVGSL
ncbi:hypothetical protein SISNIDRAFT_470824 [Sistotremastrum niveocremeum HHB9708]|uniref:Uncharacterized protein n=1 Tax=Sistotremastrum niveocremeum HHB9708 TaxID=1314777 RepID=A0A164NC31_9AGAM|nr:hypothetical protein SISNIDRAFT_470824 [Sistotremastrum niveocremeum HHB9708]